MANVDVFSDWDQERWLSWTIHERLHDISRAIDRTYKPQDEWNMNEAKFRKGMAVEAVRHDASLIILSDTSEQAWICRLLGWAAIWRITVDPAVRELYTRVVAASEGTLSLDDSLIMGDELWRCKRKYAIIDGEAHAHKMKDNEFKRVCPEPPTWWRTLAPDAAESAGPAARAHRRRHLCYVVATRYALQNPVRPFCDTFIDALTQIW